MTGGSILQDQYAFRDQMVEALERDLIGPVQEQEVLDENPLDRYLMGVLYPTPKEHADAEVDDSEQEDPEVDEPEAADGAGPDAEYDPGVALALTRQPSSMGLSFSVDLSRATQFKVRVTAGRYREEDAAGERVGVDDARDRRRRGRKSGEKSWRRSIVEPDQVSVDVTTPQVLTVELADGLELYCVVRRGLDGRVPVTVVLRNTLESQRGQLRDGYCWFQPKIIVTSDQPAFVERSDTRKAQLDDDDVASYDLLFRNALAFAVGHGCSVNWNESNVVAVDRLETTFVPRYEVPLATPREASFDTDLRMGFLADATTDDIVTSLNSLVRDYRSWIEIQRQNAQGLTAGLRGTADRHLDDAQRTAERMHAGVQLLREPRIEAAFRLMNQVMREQRRRQDWIRAGSDGALPSGDEQAWRPFQIAFILLNLEGLWDPSSPDRRVADLLWFPTGGGKTEAYLGLIAFTVFLRRLTDPNDTGVAVIMRYTLRLLTLQQFERAAALICSMEYVRRSKPQLGSEPISLGLWVGQAATPNNLLDARRALNKLKRGEELDEGNPVQLTKCPWCGTKLSSDDYRVDPSKPPLLISCHNRTCDFAGGLPLYVVDEDVYRVRPSLLIGTVDKFAMMAWNERVRAIFSSDSLGNPPDLIVQDELHLISGPLGTMVGLYETAVDAAASRSNPVKIVASTATIRRAEKQMRAVFDRESRQFPPPGLDISDSFFAQEATREEKGTRCYVGLLAPGKSPTTLLVRTYARLLQEASVLPATDEVRDPYWTLVGYFNSLRVLGGAFMQVNDDVPDRIRLIAARQSQDERILDNPLELTSRIPSSRVPDYLDLLGHAFPAPSSPDVVLATNMISVGVDVDRLGLMAVMGQPQATAEYIQATSRVGRKHPGLVVVMYNGARSRDRSHYENFLPYHQSLYREVEATSATPFAARARDRGLHGTLVAMARLLISKAAANDSAAQVADFSGDLTHIASQIADRAGRAEGDDSVARDTLRQLNELIRVWISDAGAMGSIKYDWSRDPEASLLVEAGRALVDDRIEPGTSGVPWPTLMSLRDVDAESNLYLVPNREGRRRK